MKHANSIIYVADRISTIRLVILFYRPTTTERPDR